jgi:hypothetical protein
MSMGTAQANFARKRKTFALQGKHHWGRQAMENQKREEAFAR